MNKLVIACVTLLPIAVALPLFGVHPVVSVGMAIIGIFSGILGFGKMEEEGLLN